MWHRRVWAKVFFRSRTCAGLEQEPKMDAKAFYTMMFGSEATACLQSTSVILLPRSYHSLSTLPRCTTFPSQHEVSPMVVVEGMQTVTHALTHQHPHVQCKHNPSEQTHHKGIHWFSISNSRSLGGSAGQSVSSQLCGVGAHVNWPRDRSSAPSRSEKQTLLTREKSLRCAVGTRPWS